MKSSCSNDLESIVKNLRREINREIWKKKTDEEEKRFNYQREHGKLDVLDQLLEKLLTKLNLLPYFGSFIIQFAPL